MNESRKKQAPQDDYLWDRTGEPDADIQAFERSLEEFRATTLTPPAFPDITPEPRHSSWWLALPSFASLPRFAAATLTITAIAAGLLLSLRESPPHGEHLGWTVDLSPTTQLSGSPSPAPKTTSYLQIGEVFETDRLSTANIAVADIGRLEVQPSTRLRLLQSREGRQRVALDHGTIQATIWAPPGEFVMDTPSAIAVDLGCMYSLRVDDTGAGLLRTTLGWVGFQSRDRESFIPAGAAVAIYPRTGPGLPYFEDASDAFRSAVASYDSSQESPAQHAQALQIVLRQARPRDALTLWHLLARVPGNDRSAVYDRLAALAAPPPGVTREGILRLERPMLDSWWNALDLGDITLWRRFKQSWPVGADPRNSG